MTGKDYEPMFAVLRSIERTVKEEWSLLRRPNNKELLLPLARIGLEQTSLVGAKAANLAHIGNALGLSTPPGFAITTAACHEFLHETGLSEEIDSLLAELSDDDPTKLAEASRRIGERIMAMPLPEAIDKAIAGAATVFPAEGRLAVRSSAIGEDGDISFAGQYTSVLNVAISEVALAYRQVIASLYSASALSYRMHHGLDDRETPMGVLVLAMVQPQYSGVLYTADPTGEDDDSLRVSAVAGLGDQLVGGDASPELSFRLAKKTLALVAAVGGDGPFTDPPLFLRELADHALRLEAHFQRPIDIEWTVDLSGRLFFLQVRPLLIVADEDKGGNEVPLEYAGHPVLLQGGKCAAGGVVSGRVLQQRSISLETAAPPLEPDTILVTRTASTTFTPWVSKVRGIITDVGGTASHLASVAREFGVPALFDTKIATATLKDGDTITLWASQNLVYQGEVQDLLRGVRQTSGRFSTAPPTCGCSACSTSFPRSISTTPIRPLSPRRIAEPSMTLFAIATSSRSGRCSTSAKPSVTPATRSA